MSKSKKRKQPGVAVRLGDEAHAKFSLISAQTGLPISRLVQMASEGFFAMVEETGEVPVPKVSLEEEGAAA